MGCGLNWFRPELKLPLLDLLHLTRLQVTQVVVLVTHLQNLKSATPLIECIILTGSTLKVARPRDASLPAKPEYGLQQETIHHSDQWTEYQ